MGKKKATLTSRAWSLLRMALLWARKGGGLKQRLMVDLRLAVRHLKSTLGAGGHPYGELQYRGNERELSFDETPTFHFKIHRPRFPCIEPPFSTPDDNDDDDDSSCVFYKTRSDQENADDHDEGGDDNDDGSKHGVVSEDGGGGGGGIDSKAEEFIAKFYEQMKLQRQVSLLQYNEMLHRGMS